MTRRLLAIVVGLTALFAVACAGGDESAGQGVPMFRGNPARTGINPGPGVERSPELLWRFETDGIVESSPAVVDGVLYIHDGDHTLYALSASAGEELWHFEMGELIPSSPAVTEGVVYIGGGESLTMAFVFALDALTGEERWRTRASLGVRSSAAVVDGVVYVGSLDGHVYALGAATGSQRWRFNAGDSVSSSPAVVGGVVYIGSGRPGNRGFVRALNAATGEEQWLFKTAKWVSSSPAVVDGVVYVGSGDSYAYAVDAITGKQRWRFKTGGLVRSSPAVADEAVYIGSNDGYLYALHAATGDERWRFNAGGPVASSPTVVDGVVYIAGTDGHLYALDGATGAERWRFKLGPYGSKSSPAVVDGVVYVGGGGYVYAVTEGENGDIPPGRADLRCRPPANVESYRFTMRMKIDVPELEEEIQKTEQELQTAQAEGEQDTPAQLAEALALALAGLVDTRVEEAFVAPDRSEARVRVGDRQLASITIGDHMWIKVGDLGWQQSPGDAGAVTFMTYLCEGLAFPELSGLEAREEMTSHITVLHYRLDQADFTAVADLLGGDPRKIWDIDVAPEDLTLDLWVAKEGNWPVRLEAEGRGKDEEGNDISLSIFMEVKDLNDPDIKIEPPITSD